MMQDPRQLIKAPTHSSKSLQQRFKTWVGSNGILVLVAVVVLGGTVAGWLVWRSSFPAPTSKKYISKIEACVAQHPPFPNKTYYVEQKNVDILKHNICETFIVGYEQASGKNYVLNNILIVLSVLAGIFLALVNPSQPRGGKIAAFIGAITTALVGLRSSIPLSQGSDFYRGLAAEGDVLLNRLSFSTVSSSDYQQILESYNKLLLKAAQNPSGLSTNSSPSSSPTSSQKP